MKSLIRRFLVGLVGLVILVALGIGGWYLYRIVTRPTLEGSGGTILVYEVDTDTFPEGQTVSMYLPEELAEALHRRLDPGHWLGITVRPLSDTRVEIRIPRFGDHEAQVQLAKELITRVGSLEFRILANNQDDPEAIAAARAYFQAAGDPQVPEDKRAERQRELANSATRGLPPPSPRNPQGSDSFPWSNEWGSGAATYAWVELGRSERQALNVDNAAKDDPARNQRWEEARKAREAGQTLVLSDLGQAVLYSRACSNAKLSPTEQAGKQHDYFLLSREPAPGETIGGQHLISADETVDARQQPVLAFRFNSWGGNLFYGLTSQNKPSDSGGNRFHRHLAIILDGQILSAPRLNEAIRERGQISGNFTRPQVEQMATILRAGALPATLKPWPVSETVVEPHTK